MTDRRIFDRVIDILREFDYAFVERFTPQRLEFRVDGRSGPISLYLLTYEAAEQIIAYSVAPFFAEPADFARTAEFICRVNNRLSEGAFVLDYDNGQLQFRTSLYVDRDRISAQLVRKLLNMNCTIMDTHMAALGRVVLDAAPPDVAARRDPT